MDKNWLEWIMGLGMVVLIAALFWHVGERKVEAAGVEIGQEWGVAADGIEQEPGNVRGPVVVLDAGHGGVDPGKVGVDGTLEKDINLQVTLLLKRYLEAADVKVILTRDADEGLYQSGDTNKKRADMEARCAIIQQAQPRLVVSIHQNSYHEASVKGAQVFYYKGSVQGQQLAQMLQQSFDRVLGENNTRQAKGNDQYYLLLHTSCPVVIVECGFLSNWEETAKLKDPSYQEQIAWSLHMGILQYINES